MTRFFYTTEEEKTLFRSTPLRLDFSLEGALRKTSWLTDRAFGVVTTRLGLAVRVRTPHIEQVVKLVQSHNMFLGKLWDVSGLPPSWRPDAVTDFLAGWKVSPVKTCRQDHRRTWVVRAMEQPMTAKLQHKFGLAVIKRTVMQKARQNQEIQKWSPASERKKTGRDGVHPQTWAAVDAVPAPQKSSGRQRTEGVNRGAGNIPAKQNSESEHYTHRHGPWRCCANSRP